MQYENLDDSTGTKHLLEGSNIHGTAVMADSSFQIRPFLDATLIEFSSSEIIYTSHTDPNTGNVITDFQVGLINTVQLIVRDIYGNEFTEGHDVTFQLNFTPDGGATTNYTSTFNPLTSKYEFYVVPTVSGLTHMEIYEIHTSQHVSGSPDTHTVLAGKYDPNKFILAPDGGSSCYIGVTCTLILSMYDSYGNPVLEGGLSDPNADIDSLVVGPIASLSQVTSKIVDITENTGAGTYNLKFLATISGQYEVYTRVSSLQIATYPLVLDAVSNKASAGKSYIAESPVSPSIAGQTIEYNLYVLDDFGNLATDETIPISAVLNLTGIIEYNATITKISTARYLISFTPTVRGDYSLEIKIFDQSEAFVYIKDIPQTQIIYADFISIAHSTYNGTGLNSGRFGFIENYDLFVRDQYSNLYHEEFIFYDGINNPVYKITYMADDTDPKNLIVIDSDPTQGTYNLGYRIVNAYSFLYIRIWLFVTNDDGVTYNYEPVAQFPIIVPIVFSPSDLLNEYTNLYLGGIGITEKSQASITNTITAGSGMTKFMEVYPKNAYDLNYTYDENRDYVLADAKTHNDGSEYCLWDEISTFSKTKLSQIYSNVTSLGHILKNWEKFSYSKDACNLFGLCDWNADNTQSKNFHFDDWSPKIWDSWTGINTAVYEGKRNYLETTLSGVIYEVSGSFTKAGEYDIRISVLSMGLLRVVAYKSTYFTYQLFEQDINWIAIGMNKTFNPLFETKTMYYSMKIEGFFSCLVSDTYTIFLDTKYKATLYIDGVKYLSGDQRKFIKDLFNDRFYALEIRIVVNERLPDSESILPYVKLRWSSESIEERDIKPRNFYALNPLEINGNKILTVLAAAANPLNSTVIDTTTNIQGTEYDEERRLTYKILNNGESITGYLEVYDIYRNLRGPQGETADTVQARLYKDWVLIDTLTLTQDSGNYRYEYSFTPTIADYYQVGLVFSF